HFKGYAIVNDNGSFSYKGLRLIEGLNMIYAVAINERNIASDASNVEIIYDNISPEIEIIKVENPGFSPNNDGVSDKFRVSFKLNEDGRIQYVLKSSQGAILQSGEILTVNNRIESFEWHGKINDILHSEGQYSLILSAYDNAGNGSLYNRDNIISITLDNTPPNIEKFEVNDSYISPNNDYSKDDCILYIGAEDNLSDEIIVDLKIVDKNGVVIKRIMDYEKSNVGSFARMFPEEGETNIDNGEYKAVLKIYDLAGNRCTQQELNIYVNTTPPADTGTIYTAYNYFSPNGDGIKDTLPVYFELNKDSDVYLIVYDSEDNIVNNIYLADKKGGMSYVEALDGKNKKGEDLS
ncbi:MAG: Ig-like domain repeat protein, partial [Spirochaetes bacterium]|nr:Ig-like domain repeat protein [Spirochaetota bacterium]